jgi:hypothetical protein
MLSCFISESARTNTMYNGGDSLPSSSSGSGSDIQPPESWQGLVKTDGRATAGLKLPMSMLFLKSEIYLSSTSTIPRRVGPRLETRVVDLPASLPVRSLLNCKHKYRLLLCRFKIHAITFAFPLIESTPRSSVAQRSTSPPFFESPWVHFPWSAISRET